MAKKKAKFKMSSEEFSKFISLIDELNKISEEHKLIWDQKGILVYTIEGENNNEKINVLKTFYIDREKLFSNLDKDLNLIYTLYNAKMFVKKFNFIMMSDDSEYNVTFDYDDETNNVLLLEVSNTELEMRAIASENSIKTLSIDDKKRMMDKSAATTTFEVGIEDLEKIKKISKLEDGETLDLKIENNTVKFSEAQWELTVKQNHEAKDEIITFKKAYLNAIVPAKDVIEISMFPTYVLVDEHKSQMLFTIELTA